MAELELHINVSGAGKPEAVSKLVQDAMDLREPQIRTVIPAGYRCVECYQDDGGHGATCSLRLSPPAEETSP